MNFHPEVKDAPHDSSDLERDVEPTSELISPGKKSSRIDEELAEIRKQNKQMTEMFEKMKNAVTVKEKKVQELLDTNKVLQAQTLKAENEAKMGEFLRLQEYEKTLENQLKIVAEERARKPVEYDENQSIESEQEEPTSKQTSSPADQLKKVESEKKDEAKCCKVYFNKHIRQKFMIKVYSVLAVQLSFTAACVIAVANRPDLTQYLKQRGWIMFAFLGAVMAGMFLLGCCEKTFRQVPLNYLLLVYFTIAWSGMVASFCAFQDPLIILIASIMTAFMTVGLSLVSISIANEMTWCYGIGATLLLATWPAIVFGVLRPDYTRTTIMAFFGTIIASIYIIIDTAKIMASYGKTDEYIFGALALYKDILVLFMTLLQILGQSSR